MTIAVMMMENYPKACLGIETVPGLNETITSAEALTRARRDWGALASVLANETDYVLEVRGDDILIKPKLSPREHDGPVVERTVIIDLAKDAPKTISEALTRVSFRDVGLKFAPFLLVSSKTYPDNKILIAGSDSADSISRLLPDSDHAPKLSDALFLIARLAGANCWSYQSYDSIQIEGRANNHPRKLTEGNLSFSGPPF